MSIRAHSPLGLERFLSVILHSVGVLQSGLHKLISGGRPVSRIIFSDTSATDSSWTSDECHP